MKFSPTQGTILGGLPVVVSGIVFWGMVLVGLLAIAFVSREQEKSLKHQLELNAQVLTAMIEEVLEHSPQNAHLADNRVALISLVEQEMAERGFRATRISNARDEILVGKIPAEADSIETLSFAHMAGTVDVGEEVSLRFYFDNLEATITAQRNELFVTIGTVVFVFGFVLQQILQRVLSKPIMDMVDVASRFAGGDNKARFDESRKDELGYMAKFINSALDNVLAQQQATQRALEQLSVSQKALQEQHDLLEQRVRERTEELRAANKELEAYSYSIAHDLRQPLRAIDGFSMLLMEDLEDRLGEQERTYIVRVREAAQRMGHLIDDILELSKITRADIVLHEVDLSAEVRAITQRLRDTDPQRNVQFKVAEGLSARADSTLARVVLENLLGNAWKYSAENPAAQIEFGNERINGCNVYFVKDNGIGFDEAYTHKLFRPFERLHSDQRFEGTGIGLATVARAVQRMGGEVWAKSPEENGAIFYFTLSRGEKDISEKH